MPDQAAMSRVRRQREARSAEGWMEVAVWVPTEADAEDVKKLAEERRARAEALHGLSQKVKTVSIERENRIAMAIAEQGSKAYISEYGAVLELMTQLLEEDDLEGFSHAVVILARAKPVKAALVINAVPAKISNFLVLQRGVNPSKMLRWAERNPTWADDLKISVRDPVHFAAVVDTMAKAINSDGTEH